MEIIALITPSPSPSPSGSQLSVWLPALTGLMGALIGGGATLIGTIIGGVIGYKNASDQWRRQQRADRNRFLSVKLEELSHLVLEVQYGLRQFFVQTMARINGLPQPKDAELSRPVPLEQMELLAALYFPSLQQATATVVAARDKLGECFADSISQPPAEKEARQKMSLEASRAYESVEAACQSFMKEATLVASSLA
jgi:hypothetical protein